jgi:hypothetical protein
MAHYRAFVVGADGHFQTLRRTFECDTEENAIVWAEQLLEEHPIELWSGAAGETPVSSRQLRRHQP